MANDFIRVDQSTTTARAGALLAQLAIEVRICRDLAAKIKGMMEHNINATDYGGVEALFGVTATNGQVVYNLVVGTLVALQTSDPVTLTDRVG